LKPKSVEKLSRKPNRGDISRNRGFTEAIQRDEAGLHTVDQSEEGPKPERRRSTRRSASVCRETDSSIRKPYPYYPFQSMRSPPIPRLRWECAQAAQSSEVPLRVFRHGQEHKQTDPKKAEKFAQQRMAELRTDTYLSAANKKTRVEELVGDLFTDYKINRAKSIDDAKTRWSLHLKPFFRVMRATDVSNPLLKRYVASRHAEGASNGSINRELALLKRAFNLGYEARKVREVPIFPHLEESKPRKGFLEEAQYGAIVQGASIWFRAIVETGRTYGWRISELLTLHVRQIDLLSRTIRLDDSKNGEGRLAVMTDAV
jgi:hypothetical protein